MLQRGWSYIVKAGTVILVCNFVVQLMQSFGWNFSPVENAGDSILATVSFPFSYLFAPIIGMVAWQFAAATITGFIAKENVVGTLAVCLVGIENLVLVGTDAPEGAVMLTRAAALAYLMFNLFTPPCFAAIGAMHSEMKSGKWLAAGLGMQFGVGYTVSFLVYFFGTLFGGGFSTVWMPILGWAVVLAFVAMLVIVSVMTRKAPSTKKVKTEATA